jgi:hypothetical protein
MSSESYVTRALEDSVITSNKKNYNINMSTGTLYTRESSPRNSGVKMVGAGSRRYPEPERVHTIDAEPMSDYEETLAETTRYMKSVGAHYKQVKKDLDDLLAFSLKKRIMASLLDKGENVKIGNEFFKYHLHTVSVKLLPIIGSIVRQKVLKKLEPMSFPQKQLWAKVNVDPVLGVVASKVTHGNATHVNAVNAQLAAAGVNVIKEFNLIIKQYPELKLYHAFVPNYSANMLKTLRARRVKYLAKSR